MNTRIFFCAGLLALGAVSAGAQDDPRRLPPTAIADPRPLTPEQTALRARSEAGGARVAAFTKTARERMKAARFSGEIGIAYAHRDRRKAYEASPASVMMAQDADGNVRKAGQPWRWASVTKQVIAVLVMQEAARGRIDPDKPIARYLPAFASPNAARITVRQLLRHQTGLPNPDDTPGDAGGVPNFYTPSFTGSRDPQTGYCAGLVKGEPGQEWSYNNCDYMVAGALLAAVTGKSWQELVQQRLDRPFSQLDERFRRSLLSGMNGIATNPPSPEVWPGTVGGKPEPDYLLASYDAAGAMSGTVGALLAFDIHLAAGNLLPPAAMAELWDGKPELGYLALGQWAFDASLAGCAAPVRIIERRGGIGGVQVRNFILPDFEMALAMFSDDADFEFGEIWQGAGFSHEMLSLAACPQGAP